MLTYVGNEHTIINDICRKRGDAMPRKPRCRNIGGYPDYWMFTPEETSSEEAVVMSLDELETIRLIDHDGNDRLIRRRDTFEDLMRNFDV